MKYEEEFIKEVIRRCKENVDMIESSFKLANINLIKNKLYTINPIEYHLPVILEEDPYQFLNKIIYSIINKQQIKVGNSNIACNLLLEIINLVLEEFNKERIERIDE